MEERRVADILAAHADNLMGSTGPEVHPRPDELTQLRSLMDVAERLRQALVPVEPPAAFVHSLGRELIEAARRRQTAARRLRRAIVVGAAALGSVLSLAGLVALLLMRRRARPPAGSPSGPVTASP